MAIPASGPISMSMLNVEVGKAFNAANTALAGGSTPTVGSLFWLGAQSGSLNQTAPHAMSEWYGYTAVTVPSPLIKIDAFSSSFVGTTVSNVGSGGTAYDLTAFDGLAIGGTGTSSYFDFAGGKKILSSSLLAFDLSASNFTVDMWYYTPSQTGSYYLMGNTASYSGLLAEPAGGEPFKTRINMFWSGSSGTNVQPTASVAANTWYQLTYVYNYVAPPGNPTSSIYLNKTLVASVISFTYFNTGSYRLYLGRGPYDTGFGAVANYRLANFSLWKEALTTSSINNLFNEFDSRY